MNEAFRKFSSRISSIVGSAGAFSIAALVVIVWAISGPLFDFSQTWQLVINTGTTIVTFLMVFLIQNTQNRDSKSIHLQLDELIESSKSANNVYLNLDNMSDAELDRLGEHFRHMHEKVQHHHQKRLKN